MAEPSRTSSSAVIQLLRQSLDRGRWSPGEPLRQEEIAAESGYQVVDERPLRLRTGLLMFVRADVVIVDRGFWSLPGDVFRFSGYRRGLLWARVRTASGAQVVVSNTHFSPIPSRFFAGPRTRQVLALRGGNRCDG